MWIDSKTKKEHLHYSYAIHEAYYDQQGYVGAITQEPIEPYGETVEELRHAWVMMAKAFGQPILDYDIIPEPGYNSEDDPLGSCPQEQDMSISADEIVNDEEKEEPFDWETYRTQQQHEREEKEHIHKQLFVGIPTMKQLIDKIYLDLMAHR